MDVTNRNIRFTEKNGRTWAKVIDLSPSFTVRRGEKGRMIAPAVALWMRVNVPPYGKTMMVTGTVKNWKNGADMPAPFALHISTEFLPDLLAYAQRREQTVKDRAVLSYAYTKMKEAH